MLDQTPQIPPAVIEFAKENNCIQIIQNDFWNKNNPYHSFVVYNAKKYNEPYFLHFILVNNKEIRFANDKEKEEIDEIFY